VRLTSAGRLFALGAIILAALVICSRSNTGTRSFLVCLAVAAIAYLLALREFSKTRRFPRHVIFAWLVLAALWRIPFLIAPPGPDDDIHRYLWDGRVQRLGYNPYKLVPADPALARLHTPETRGLNNPEVPSPYPAGAQLFFRAVTAVHESLFAFKIAFTICDIAIALLLMNMLRRNGQGEHWVLAYAWHPLVPLNVAGSGHIDILGVLLLLASAAALGRGRRMIAATALALAVAVKLLPIVLIPLYWRRLRLRDWLMGVLVFGLLYAPFIKDGFPIGSFGTYVQRFRFNDPVFAILERVARPQIVAILAVLVGLIVAGWLRNKQRACWTDKWAWPLAASLACAPVVYPWYLLWLLPFLHPATSTLPLTIWTVGILPTYIVWHMRSLGLRWQVPGWVLLLEYGSVAAAAAVVAFRRMPKPA
jgi:GPI transamidase subunit PIG-U